MADPVVVVVPTRDRPALVREAVASVRAQTDPAWLLVVADDGDGPPVPPGAGGPPDPRVHVVRVGARSPGGARNAAVAFAEDRLLHGPAALVACLDDDDLWRPDHLARARAALAAAPDAPFVHGAAVTRRADGAEGPYHARGEDPAAAGRLSTLLAHNGVATSSVVVRGAAFSGAGRFREDLSHGEDWDLWLRLAARGPAAFVAAATAVHREHGGNVSRALAAKAGAQARVLSGWWRARAALPPADAATLRRALGRAHRRHVRRRLADGTTPRAEVVALAAAAWREVPGLETLRARLEARCRSRARSAAPA